MSSIKSNKMHPIAIRFELFRKFKDLKKNEFANILEIVPASYSNYMKDRTPSLGVIVEVVKKFPEINANWLLTGEGEMFAKPAESSGLDSLERENYELLKENRDLRKELDALRAKHAEVDPQEIKLEADRAMVDVRQAKSQGKKRSSSD